MDSETPTPYGFDLDPGEEITRIIHRHVLTLFPAFLGIVGLVITAVLLAFAEGRFPDTIPFPRVMVFALIIIFLVLAALIFLISIFVYERNVLIFTNVHLIQAEQYGLFNHRVSQISFVRVQDVTGSRNGFFQTIFNFGNVEIQSAGEEEKFIFRGAPNPQDIADDVLEIHEKCLRVTGQAEPG
jgi:membrane protein YdbS with pleckstrin-like domain